MLEGLRPSTELRSYLHSYVLSWVMGVPLDGLGPASFRLILELGLHLSLVAMVPCGMMMFDCAFVLPAWQVADDCSPH